MYSGKSSFGLRVNVILSDVVIVKGNISSVVIFFNLKQEDAFASVILLLSDALTVSVKVSVRLTLCSIFS